MKNKLFSISLLILSIYLFSCKKEVPNIFNQFDVKLTLHDKLPLSVTDYKLVNDGDSVYFDYTIESPNKDMYVVNLIKAGSSTPMLKIPITDPAKRRSYSGTIGLKMDGGSGMNTYRIYATDIDVVYLGDGYKTVSVEVAPNYINLSNRNLFAPDSATGKLNSFLSLNTGETFNYASTGAANAAKIDLGVYFKGTGTATDAYNVFFYSLSASPNPFTPFNVSGWANKRTTLFSDRIAGQATTFLSTLTSAANIRKAAQAKTINLKSVVNGSIAGGMIYFLTPEGKYGALIINAITETVDRKPFANVSIKYEK